MHLQFPIRTNRTLAMSAMAMMMIFKKNNPLPWYQCQNISPSHSRSISLFILHLLRFHGISWIFSLPSASIHTNETLLRFHQLASNNQHPYLFDSIIFYNGSFIFHCTSRITFQWKSDLHSPSNLFSLLH